MSNKEVKSLMVSAGSPVRELAGSILKSYDTSCGGEIELRAIGAGSVNQMYKALAIARSMFAQRGNDLYIKPGFDEAEIKGEKRTVMVAKLDVR